MYFLASRNFWMRAPIEAIPVALDSTRKVGVRCTCVFPSTVFLTRGEILLALGGPVLARKFSVPKNVVSSPERAPRDRIDKNRPRLVLYLRGVFGIPCFCLTRRYLLTTISSACRKKSPPRRSLAHFRVSRQTFRPIQLFVDIVSGPLSSVAIGLFFFPITGI